MSEIDLDDLPPRIAALLQGLGAGQSLTLVRAGVVVGALKAVAPAPLADPLADLPPEERMAEVLEQFNAMIHDEF